MHREGGPDVTGVVDHRVPVIRLDGGGGVSAVIRSGLERALTRHLVAVVHSAGSSGALNALLEAGNRSSEEKRRLVIDAPWQEFLQPAEGNALDHVRSGGSMEIPQLLRWLRQVVLRPDEQTFVGFPIRAEHKGLLGEQRVRHRVVFRQEVLYLDGVDIGPASDASSAYRLDLREVHNLPSAVTRSALRRAGSRRQRTAALTLPYDIGELFPDIAVDDLPVADAAVMGMLRPPAIRPLASPHLRRNGTTAVMTDGASGIPEMARGLWRFDYHRIGRHEINPISGQPSTLPTVGDRMSNDRNGYVELVAGRWGPDLVIVVPSLEWGPLDADKVTREQRVFGDLYGEYIGNLVRQTLAFRTALGLDEQGRPNGGHWWQDQADHLGAIRAAQAEASHRSYRDRPSGALSPGPRLWVGPSRYTLREELPEPAEFVAVLDGLGALPGDLSPKVAARHAELQNTGYFQDIAASARSQGGTSLGLTL